MSEKEKRESEQKLVHELELIRDAKKLTHENEYFQNRSGSSFAPNFQASES